MVIHSNLTFFCLKRLASLEAWLSTGSPSDTTSYFLLSTVRILASTDSGWKSLLRSDSLKLFIWLSLIPSLVDKSWLSNLQFLKFPDCHSFLWLPLVQIIGKIDPFGSPYFSRIYLWMRRSATQIPHCFVVTAPATLMNKHFDHNPQDCFYSNIQSSRFLVSHSDLTFIRAR